MAHIDVLLFPTFAKHMYLFVWTTTPYWLITHLCKIDLIGKTCFFVKLNFFQTFKELVSGRKPTKIRSSIYGYDWCWFEGFRFNSCNLNVLLNKAYSAFGICKQLQKFLFKLIPISILSFFWDWPLEQEGPELIGVVRDWKFMSVFKIPPLRHIT